MLSVCECMEYKLRTPFQLVRSQGGLNYVSDTGDWCQQNLVMMCPPILGRLPLASCSHDFGWVWFLIREALKNSNDSFWPLGGYPSSPQTFFDNKSLSLHYSGHIAPQPRISYKSHSPLAQKVVDGCTHVKTRTIIGVDGERGWMWWWEVNLSTS